MRVLGQIGHREPTSDQRQSQLPGDTDCWYPRPKTRSHPVGAVAQVHKDLAQALGVDLTIFQGFVQTGPGPLKKGRERQLWKATRSGFAGERVHQVEQGVFAVAKAAVHPVTKVVQCVTAHGSNAPDFGSFGRTLVRISTTFEAKLTRISAKS